VGGPGVAPDAGSVINGQEEPVAAAAAAAAAATAARASAGRRALRVAHGPGPGAAGVPALVYGGVMCSNTVLDTSAAARVFCGHLRYTSGLLRRRGVWEWYVSWLHALAGVSPPTGAWRRGAKTTKRRLVLVR